MTKPVREWTIADLQALTGLEETSSLEFKASAALENTQGKKAELVKDVTAMANAAGGQIVFGMKERPSPDNAKVRLAEGLDDGSDVSPEWIDQVLGSNIEPRIAGLYVHRIPLAQGRAAYVIDIPMATALAPHQSKIDQRYHRRSNTTVQAMLDHEVRDLMRRGATPELYCTLHFEPLPGDGSQYMLVASLGNNASEPALYTSVYIALDHDLRNGTCPLGFEKTEVISEFEGRSWRVVAHLGSLIVPHELPIFKENERVVFLTPVIVQSNTAYFIEYRVACPGFILRRRGLIVRNSGKPLLEWH